MGVETSPHVSARQVVRWALQLYRHGIREVPGLTLEFNPYSAGLGAAYSFAIILQANGHETVGMCGFCQEDLSPMQVNVFCPGTWCCDFVPGCGARQSQPAGRRGV